jgi:hypothetical protein
MSSLVVFIKNPFSIYIIGNNCSKPEQLQKASHILSQIPDLTSIFVFFAEEMRGGYFLLLSTKSENFYPCPGGKTEP